MKLCHVIYLFQLFIVSIKCNDKEGTESKNSLPYFRRKIVQDLHNLNSASEDAQGHIASFLIDNAKEIMNNNDEITEFSVPPLLRSVTILKTENSINTRGIEETPKLADDVKVFQNISLTTMIYPYELVSPGYDIRNAKHTHMMLLSEKAMKKSEQKIVRNYTYILVSSLAPETKHKEPVKRRSCIFCDNVSNDDCSDPKNKLIPSIICEHEEDQCYSMHTPFGIIDRGCFNAIDNLTIYVCACNLCNHLQVMEMPHVFSNKREWVHNVAELSRIRNLRSSVHKDMACLKCEVNTTLAKKYSNDDENCLNGNIGSLPTEICNVNEVCAVKMLKSEGYVWRGCTRTPLYNYWLYLCDRDLCNYDSLIPMYDYI